MPRYQANWHHVAIAAEFEAFARGDTEKLMVLVPPRHGKTELCTKRGIPWVMGRNPDERVIMATYAAQYAGRINRALRTNMEDQRHLDVFPHGSIHSGTAQRKESSLDRFQMARGDGYVITCGVGGAITGDGATRGIVDDPIKNWEESRSEVVRNKIWDWYGGTYRTRFDDEGGRNAEMLIQTPWHEDGLWGRLLKEEGHLWRVVVMPAILEAPSEYEGDTRALGEPLWESRFPIERLNKIRGGVIEGVNYGAGVGSDKWQSLYQCNPTPPGGNKFKDSWWQYYDGEDALPPRQEWQGWFQSWDLNAGEETADGSYVVGSVWLRCTGPRYYLVDLVRGRWAFPETMRQHERLSKRWPRATVSLVEKKAAGSPMISTLRLKHTGIIAIEPKGSKEARADAVLGTCEARQVFLPSNADWLPEFKREIRAFPNGKHDDQVDVLTQFLNHVESSGMVAYKSLSSW